MNELSRQPIETGLKVEIRTALNTMHGIWICYSLSNYINPYDNCVILISQNFPSLRKVQVFSEHIHKCEVKQFQLLLLSKVTLIEIHAYLFLITTYHTQGVTQTSFQQLGVPWKKDKKVRGTAVVSKSPPPITSSYEFIVSRAVRDSILPVISLACHLYELMTSSS